MNEIAPSAVFEAVSASVNAAPVGSTPHVEKPRESTPCLEQS